MLTSQLTEDRLRNLDPKLVYAYIKTGTWNMKDFLKWVELISSKNTNLDFVSGDYE